MTINTAELTALIEKATSGPWFAGGSINFPKGNGDDQWLMKIWPDQYAVGGLIARTGHDPFSGWDEQAADDAALIVAAVNALPALLAEREALRKALEPFTTLEIPTNPVGNAGFYSLLFRHLRVARTAYEGNLNNGR